MLKSLIRLFLITGGLISLTACSDTGSWKEDVKLLDGREITVTQTRRFEGSYNGVNYGSVVREVWLTLKLPEFGNQEIIWHENLLPWVVNVYKGKLYVVGWPPTGREFYLYGGSRPPYIGFVYENNKWKRIPFAEIPVEIYDVNMWIDNTPPNKSDRIGLADKDKQKQGPRYPDGFKKIDPRFNSNF